MKAGMIPYFVENGEIHVCLFVSNDAQYGGDKPQIAKGHIDEGETWLDAAFREVEEETGIKILDENIVDISCLYAGAFRGQVSKYGFIVAGVEIDRKIDTSIGDEGEGIWMRLPEAINKIRGDQKFILENLIKN